jgi:hypothetical protein
MVAMFDSPAEIFLNVRVSINYANSILVYGKTDCRSLLSALDFFRFQENRIFVGMTSILMPVFLQTRLPFR